MEKAQNLWLEDKNRKHVLINSDVLHRIALGPSEDFSKESSAMSDSKPFTASKGALADGGILLN